MRGSEPGRRLVDLANALRADPQLSRDGLAGLLRRHGESAADVAPGAFGSEDAEALRHAVRRLTAVLLETDTDRAARALNTLLAECGARPRLSRHDGHPWHLHVDRGDEAGWGDWFTAASALELARLLSERGRVAWGECAAPGCPVFHLDDGRGSPRRYCSARCASRARVAAHRRREAARAGEEAQRRKGPATS